MTSPFAKFAAEVCGFADPSTGVCPMCRTPHASFPPWKDELSQREFKISGLCQTCQDTAFAPPEDDDLGPDPLGPDPLGDHHGRNE